MLIPVVLSGGAGTRLWPISREGHPKPFMTLQDGETLLAKTYARAASVLPQGGPILTVTNRDYYFMSKDEWQRARLGVQYSGHFLLEPYGRNTAAAIAMAALWVVARHGRNALLLVLPADHLIRDTLAFVMAVQQAVALAQAGRLSTFGILPTSPETGFGYLECGAPVDNVPGCSEVARFIEKPSLASAQSYLQQGGYLWNSGMFCFSAGVLLDSMAVHAPDVAMAAEQAWARSQTAEPSAMLEIDADSYAAVPDISIDYAVMERAPGVAVVPSDFDWSDIGSWTAVRQLLAPDAHGNRHTGDAVLVDSQNTFIHGEDRLVAAVGVVDLLVIDTPDALLVARSDRAQDVKQVVSELKQRNHDAYKVHRTVSRPWGTYTVLQAAPGFKIKRIEVKPGASLSLQMHHHRSEHWIVVSGMAKVVNGEQELYIKTNESTFIPAGQKHRLENPGKLPLALIEVQCGEYLGEDDIVRFQDVYGRA